MEIIKLVEKYFNFFSKKDIHKLNSLFADNISLIDWEIEAKGIKEVIEVNKKIFNSTESIDVTLINMYQDKLVVTCLIDILINKIEKLKVVDIIKFNEDKKIEEILAFKQ